MATFDSLQLTETINNKRYYNIVKDNLIYKLPSVTTILSEMTNKESINRWKQRVGIEKAEAISRFSANRGTCMHQKLEYWFLSDIKDEAERLIDVNEKMRLFIVENSYTESELMVGDKLFDSLYYCGFFKKVDSIIEMENTLYSFEQGGYAGRVDCIYNDINGKSVLLDFKTSKHKKKKEWITNYYMQLSAYYLAYYQMYGIKLDRAELWIAVENDAPQLIEITQDELKSWLKIFLGLVRDYHIKYDSELNFTPNKNE